MSLFDNIGELLPPVVQKTQQKVVIHLEVQNENNSFLTKSVPTSGSGSAATLTGTLTTERWMFWALCIISTSSANCIDRWIEIKDG